MYNFKSQQFLRKIMKMFILKRRIEKSNIIFDAKYVHIYTIQKRNS